MTFGIKMKLQAAILIFAAALACRAMSPNTPFEVHLLPSRQSIVAGTYPKFTLKVRNMSGKAIHGLVDLDRCAGWKEMYASLTVTQRGKPVVVGVGICDPFPFDQEDLRDLPPGAIMEVHVDGFPQLLDELPPGDYEAYVTYKPGESALEARFISNKVSLHIEPQNSPNQPPLQTPASGTPAAGAPVAPPPGAAGR